MAGYYCYITVLTFNAQYIAGAGSGAGAEIRDKGGAGAGVENK